METKKTLCFCDENFSVSRVYNVTSMSLAPRHLEEAIRKYIPEFEIVYSPPGDFRWDANKTSIVFFFFCNSKAKRKQNRQEIANSWPRSIDDSLARKDWGWSADYGVEVCLKNFWFSCLFYHKQQKEMTRDMLVLWKERMTKLGKSTVALKGI